VLGHEPLQLGPRNANGIHQPDMFDIASPTEASDRGSADAEDLRDLTRPEERVWHVALDPFCAQQGYSKKLPLTGIRLHRAAGRLGLECRVY
jgi:hypothetical protein